MHKKRTLITILIVILASQLPNAKSSMAQTYSHTFPETGRTVTGRFLQYWTEHGGLAQQGYPISDVLGEVSDTDGKLYTVQYFERAILEYHPENQPPNDVLLSLLGSFAYSANYPSGAPAQKPNSDAGSRLFAETGERLGGAFLQYWNSHGSLAQQGYPISDEFTEVSLLDGKAYRVQYFERSVFESHPEQPATNNVLLSQLGTFRYQAKYRVGSPNLSPPVPVPPALPPAPPTPAATTKDVQAFARYIQQKYGQIGSYRLQFGDTYAIDTNILGHSINFDLSQSIPLGGPLGNGPSKADGDNWAQTVFAEAVSNWPNDQFTISLQEDYYDWNPNFSADTPCYQIYELDPNKGWHVISYEINLYRLNNFTYIHNCLFDL